jgi:hypothetical protein
MDQAKTPSATLSRASPKTGQAAKVAFPENLRRKCLERIRRDRAVRVSAARRGALAAPHGVVGAALGAPAGSAQKRARTIVEDELELARASRRRQHSDAGDDTRVTGEDDTALRARLDVAQWAPPDVVAAATAAAPRAARPPAGAECDGDYVMNARGRAGAAAAVVVGACDEDCLLDAGDLSGGRPGYDVDEDDEYASLTNEEYVKVRASLPRPWRARVLSLESPFTALLLSRAPPRAQLILELEEQLEKDDAEHLALEQIEFEWCERAAIRHAGGSA